MSYAFCRTCLVRGAEPLGAWTETIWLCNGPENVHPDYIDAAVSWRNDQYIGWDEIVAQSENADAAYEQDQP
jgi:hypothetical protein